ncbi:Crp/Fnr family transcriptional regulator [Sphingomonas naphthae]|uniref:Crp/Fnr family transcriptional regulator n=1 Tax=Sphingomonas naphthae TaxID=1813468 RepID=A0ABY7THZ7_9SPHN|nr:Crp/Fnr family transcriptional regulator [Sphingomonas naphthae]WCT72606.1 Crp/Fnr family transcriptional regulator [Sphingomonas naphthae]
MLTTRFLQSRRHIELTTEERERLEGSIAGVNQLRSRTLVVQADQVLDHSTLLLEGYMCRYIDDERGLRQLVAIHVPGDFVDLHAYPLKSLDHNVSTLTPASTAIFPHTALQAINDEMPALTKKLWFATVLDAAIHRAWLFRLGRLDAIGRVAHFLSETNLRLMAVGLSDGHRYAFGITQNDLAEICGLTSVHVNRVMRSLREERLCVFRSGLVQIDDPEALARRGQFKSNYLYIVPETTT